MGGPPCPKAAATSRKSQLSATQADILLRELNPSNTTDRAFLLRNPAQFTSFLIREVPRFGQELRLRWLSASIVFSGEILGEKLGRVWRLVIGYGVVGAGQTDDDLVIPHLKLNT